MEYKCVGDKIIVRLEIDDEIIASLKDLMEKCNLKSGRISGIGATNNVTLGVYEVKNKIYNKVTHLEDMEILSLSGNLSRQNGIPYVHAHITLATLENVYGGHLNEAVISATGELIIDVIDTDIERIYNEEIGLNLFKL